MGTAQQNPLINMAQHQLDASLRLVGVVFSGKGKLDRVILDATDQAVENNLHMIRVITEVQDASQFKDLLTKLDFHPEKNMFYQQQIISAAIEIQAELAQSVRHYIERFSQVMTGKPYDGRQKYGDNELGHQEQVMFNPVTSIFSVWERAFYNAISQTNKNVATANKIAENCAYAGTYPASETASMVDVEVHDHEYAERKHSVASKKK